MPTAMGHWRRTLEIGKMAVARKPGDIAQAALGVAHWHLSRALQRNGDLEGAARHARESVVINEALVNRYPRDISRRRSLLNSYEQEGYISYEVGSPAYDDPAAAAARQARALAIAEQLAAEDPHNVRGLSDLAISQRNMCYALVPYDPAAAERMCRAGLGTADRLGNLVTHYRPQLLAGLGAALHRQPGKRSAAEQFIRDAVRLQDRSVASDPSRSELRQSLLRMHNQLGSAMLDAANLESALDQHRRALALAEGLLKPLPADPIVRRDLADTYEHLAAVAMRRAADRRLAHRERAGYWREARTWTAKSLSIWNEWSKWAVSSTFDVRRRTRAIRALSRCDAAIVALTDGDG